MPLACTFLSTHATGNSAECWFSESPLRSPALHTVYGFVHFRFKADQHIAQAALGKSVVAPRPPVSNTSTFFRNWVITVRFWLYRHRRLCPLHPTRQIGVTRVTGGFRVRKNQLHVERTRSFQSWIFFGLPLRTRNPWWSRTASYYSAGATPSPLDQLAFIVQDLYVGHLVISDNSAFKPCKIASACFDDPA